MNASNRQKKFLKFFNIPHSPMISVGAAGWEIALIFEDDFLRERWRRYLFLTRDFDSDSSDLKEFTEEDLASVVIPEGWHSSEELRKFREEVVTREMSDGSPFDCPQPALQFLGKTFMFTGKFSFGTRAACQAAVLALGGHAPVQKSVSSQIDYLIIGSEGSKAWKRGSYGNKIEEAILARREHGSPAIISEEHWKAHLNQG